MHLSNSEAMLRSGSGSLSAVLDEIDLYADLCDFLDLSPEERSQAADQQDSRQLPEVAEPKKPEPEPATTLACETEHEQSERTFDHLNTSAIEETPACVATPKFRVAQETEFEGMSPLEMFETFALDDKSFCVGSKAEARGVLSRGVCLSCGAESEAEDLFCVTCGTFLDEVASALPLNQNCADCGLRISIDDIFCPGCGAALPTA